MTNVDVSVTSLDLTSQSKITLYIRDPDAQ